MKRVVFNSTRRRTCVNSLHFYLFIALDASTSPFFIKAHTFHPFTEAFMHSPPPLPYLYTHIHHPTERERDGYHRLVIFFYCFLPTPWEGRIPGSRCRKSSYILSYCRLKSHIWQLWILSWGDLGFCTSKVSHHREAHQEMPMALSISFYPCSRASCAKILLSLSSVSTATKKIRYICLMNYSNTQI